MVSKLRTIKEEGIILRKLADVDRSKGKPFLVWNADSFLQDTIHLGEMDNQAIKSIYNAIFYEEESKMPNSFVSFGICFDDGNLLFQIYPTNDSSKFDFFFMFKKEGIRFSREDTLINISKYLFDV